MSKRQSTKLESEGAEFLVLGSLLVEGVSCYKAYVNFPGYDLMAVNPATKRVARIQVKSRWATDYDGSFPFKNTDCDFVVHVALNRGYSFSKSSRKLIADFGRSMPVFYVFPRDVAVTARAVGSWNKVSIKKIPDYETYISKWSLVKDFVDRAVE